MESDVMAKIEIVSVPCDHKWVFRETVKWNMDAGYNIHWFREDRYFCEKCLQENVKVRDEYSREMPTWYR